MQAGHILLENGAEISRVEETIDRICRHYGVDCGEAFVLSNGIFATAGRIGEQYFAKVQHIPVSGTHLNRVAAVNQLSREIEEGKHTLAGARACLEDIRTMPGKSETMQIMLPPWAAPAFVSCLAEVRQRWRSPSRRVFCSTCISCTFRPDIYPVSWPTSPARLVSVVCILAHHGMAYAGVGTEISHMIIGAVIPMVPGVAFTNGIRDIADGDYIAGSVRLLDALLVFVCIAMGVGLTFTLYSRITGGMLL